MALGAGAAKVDITPRVPCRLAGYGARDHDYEGIHDAISLRALFVRGAGGAEAVLLSADVLWFGDAAENIRSAIESELGVAGANVFMSGTHTHSAPAPRGDGGSREWLSSLEGRALAAGALAKSRLQPVTISVGRGQTHIGINRRERRPDGSVVLGCNPEGIVDREVIAVALDDLGGEPVARIANFACHGVVLGGGNYLVSGDWPGAAGTELEERMGCPVLSLNGGAGNVDPRIRVQMEFEPVREIAGEFVRDFEAACDGAAELPGDDKVAGLEHATQLPRKLRDVESGKGRTAGVVLRRLDLGPVALAGYPGEMFSQTSMAVKEKAPAPCTLVSAYVDAGGAGYCPVREAYDTGGYEVGASRYSEAAEEVLRAELIRMMAL